KENPADFGTLKTAAGEERVPTIPGRWQGYYENLRDALLGQAQPMVTLEQARRVMEVIEAARNQGV
ncbi:MAG TPA: oxidoreductase, partial [Lentisphaeria bacterium]|nr:oxidoreductase [Lentisphaeria bacterium]